MILYALAAAAIPLLIHLLNRRKIKRIPFSTIQFLKRLEKKQMRNLRIRQLLLLLIRTLIILLLVLAFARPTFTSSGGSLLSERSPIEAVIVLDNSLSLNETRMTGSLLDKLRQKFSALQDAFQAGDRITVLQATFPTAVVIDQKPFDPAIWEQSLQKTQPNYLKSDLDIAIQQAIGLLQQSAFASKELYIISDYQKTALNTTTLDASLKQVPAQNIKLFALPIAHENLENLSVDSVSVVNRLVELNQPLRIKAFLRNHHPTKHLATLTSVLLNDSRVAQQKISIPPQQLQEVQFQITLTESGFISGRIETESDALQEDNRRYFNFYVPRQIRLLHIVPHPGYQSFVPVVLQPAMDRNIFTFETVAAANWSSRNFLDFDMVIVDGLDQFPETLIARLKSFVSRGGGGLIFPGERIVTSQYDRLLKAFALGRLGELRGVPGKQEQFLTITNVQWNHPIFEGLFDDKPGQIGPIEVYAGYHILAARGAQDLIKLSDNSPLLLQSDADRGAMFFFTSPLKSDWTQLPVKGFVLPMMYRMVYFAGTRQISDRQSLRAGEVSQQHFSNLEAPFTFKLQADPTSEEIRLTPRFRGADITLEVTETALPGNYRILYNDKPLSVISVNAWQDESVMAAFNPEELNLLLPAVRVFQDTDNLAARIENSRFGKELWQYLLLAAFILMLTEMVVARTGARKAFSGQETGSPL